MNILLIAPYYAPDLGPSAPLFTMLCKALVSRGHQVTVIAMVPHLPSGQVQSAFRGKWIQRSSEEGVNVIRIRVPSIDRNSFPMRLYQYGIYQIGATFASLNLKFDSLIITAPFFTTFLPLIWHTIFRRKPTVVSVHDVYPDVGIKLGVFTNKYIISIITIFERFHLKQANIVRILSDSFRPGLRSLGITDDKMALVYDWVDTDLIIPQPKDNSFSQEIGVDNRFIVLYAGNIGLSQGLECIILTAEHLVSIKNIQFIFVGDGKGKENLQSLVEQLALSNVKFVPFQPRERLSEVLASADISLVILKHGIGSDSLPSKTFSIMASGRPIIASVDKESEVWKLINRAEAGVWVSPEDSSMLAETILSFEKDKKLCEHLGQKGRTWVEQYHSPQFAAAEFEKLLVEAISLKLS